MGGVNRLRGVGVKQQPLQTDLFHSNYIYDCLKLNYYVRKYWIGFRKVFFI